MPEAPSFFVPGVNPEDQEEAYGDFATRCGRSLPPPEERIYSITFRHDGEEWVATVGKTLTGTGPAGFRKGKRLAGSRELSDPATVLAIFAGSPFLVFTNKGPAAGVKSAWENPFMAGDLQSVAPFSTSR